MILGCSQLTYVEAVESQKKEDLIKASENALHYYGGGGPQVIVSDNLRSAVTKGSKYDAVLNEEFASFAEHYSITVIPARVYKPRDKSLVEGNAARHNRSSAPEALDDHNIADTRQRMVRHYRRENYRRCHSRPHRSPLATHRTIW